VADPASGEIEFARPRRATAGRILVALLFLGAAAGAVAWQLGWLQRLPLPSLARAPAPAPAPRVEEALPAPAPADAAAAAPKAGETPPPGAPSADRPRSDAAAAIPPAPASAAEAAPPPAPAEAPHDAATATPPALPVPPHDAAADAPPAAADAAAKAPEPPPAAASAAPAPVSPPPANPPVAALPALAPAAAPAMEEALLEPGPDGPLPIIARDGREPWRVYARPFDMSDKRPRIAIVIFGLGLSAAPTEASIKDLPGAVTLAFEPYGQRLPDWAAHARAAGHEILLSVPMEPPDYPRQDPGPYTLLTSVDATQNLRRLDWVLSRITGYVGVANVNGARFTGSRTDLLPVLEEIRKRGLMFVEGRAAEQSAADALSAPMALPRVVSDRMLDSDATRAAIDRQLSELEEVARQHGAALGVGYLYPVTVARVADWAKTLDKKGLVLAPASALGAMPGAPH